MLFRSLDVTNLDTTKLPTEPFSRFFKEKVSLSKEEISWTSDTINSFIQAILATIREKDERFALKVLNTGNTVY